MDILAIDNTLFNNFNDNVLIQIEKYFYYKLDDNLMLKFNNEKEYEELIRQKGEMEVIKLNKTEKDIIPSFTIPEENKPGRHIIGTDYEIW